MVSLDRFIEGTLERYPKLWNEYDSSWRSPCEIGEPVELEDITAIEWRPQSRLETDDFSGLENAFETEIHQSIKDYYGSYWSGGLEATCKEGHVSLMFLWNDEDRDRLVDNLIGHALAQKRSRSPLSIFFACTDAASAYFLTVNNSTGEVQLELPGRKPIRTVESSLSEFLERLVPAPPYVHPDRVRLKNLFLESAIKPSL